MRVLVAMSGGVDSSVAAALLAHQGHEVVGATLKLWGGPSDSGCCSVGDVEDARRVAAQLGVPHHVFNLSEAFEDAVVAPYVAAHAAGRTPNPCVECNRFIKFGVLVEKARRLGFDALATGHHARVEVTADGASLLRGADMAKDQSYVLSMLGQDVLRHLLLPVGGLTKAQVRQVARDLALRTAEKPDSQDVCFIGTHEGRRGFLAARIELHRGEVVDQAGTVVGRTDAVELVTVGQRRGMGHDELGRRRYVAAVDVARRRIEVGDAHAVARCELALVPASVTWVGLGPPTSPEVLAQVSAHGAASEASLDFGPSPRLRFASPQRPVAPGQTVALYRRDRPEEVLGGAIAA